MTKPFIQYKACFWLQETNTERHISSCQSISPEGIEFKKDTSLMVGSNIFLRVECANVLQMSSPHRAMDIDTSGQVTYIHPTSCDFSPVSASISPQSMTAEILCLSLCLDGFLGFLCSLNFGILINSKIFLKNQELEVTKHLSNNEKIKVNFSSHSLIRRGWVFKPGMFP